MTAFFDMLKRASVLLTALVFSALAVALAGASIWWLLVLVITLPIVALGLYDLFQR